MNTNVLVIVGNLVRDPEARSTKTGKTITEFTVAVNRSGNGDHGGADFFRCSAWESLGEIVEQYGSKGRKVCVTGRIQSRKYTGNDGAEREVWEVTAKNVEFVDRPRDETAPERVAPSAPATDPDAYSPFEDE